MFSWVLSLLPESIFILIYYIMLSAGIVLYIASKLVTWIPMMGQYKLPAEIVGVVLLVVGAYFYGGYGVQKAWLERVAELEAKVKIAEEKSQVVNTVIQTKIVERVKIVEKQVEVVKKEIEIQREVINAECKINDVAIELYNKAISDPTEIKK
jgi:predicted membrane protein